MHVEGTDFNLHITQHAFLLEFRFAYGYKVAILALRPGHMSSRQFIELGLWAFKGNYPLGKDKNIPLNTCIEAVGQVLIFPLVSLDSAAWRDTVALISKWEGAWVFILSWCFQLIYDSSWERFRAHSTQQFTRNSWMYCIWSELFTANIASLEMKQSMHVSPSPRHCYTGTVLESHTFIIDHLIACTLGWAGHVRVHSSLIYNTVTIPSSNQWRILAILQDVDLLGSKTGPSESVHAQLKTACPIRTWRLEYAHNIHKLHNKCVLNMCCVVPKSGPWSSDDWGIWSKPKGAHTNSSVHFVIFHWVQLFQLLITDWMGCSARVGISEWSLELKAMSRNHRYKVMIVITEMSESCKEKPRQCHFQEIFIVFFTWATFIHDCGKSFSIWNFFQGFSHLQIWPSSISNLVQKSNKFCSNRGCW